MQVWKYILTPYTTEVEMPAGAQLLHVNMQYGQVCLWAVVDPDAPREGRQIGVYGTGHEIPKGSAVTSGLY